MLKLIAFILMTLDHMAWLWPHIVPYQISYILRLICRLAFPIFVYDCVLGIRRTRSIPKYLSRLGLLAIISQICILFGFKKMSVFELDGFVNIFFTLFLGIIFVMSLDLFLASLVQAKLIKTPKWRMFSYRNSKIWHRLLASMHTGKKSTCFVILLLSLILIILCTISAILFHPDYGMFGLLLFACLHYLVYSKGAFSAELSKEELQRKVPDYILYLAIIIGVYLGIADYLLPRVFNINLLMFGDLQTFVIFAPYLFPLAAKSKKPAWWLSRLLYFYYPVHLLLISLVRYLTI